MVEEQGTQELQGKLFSSTYFEFEDLIETDSESNSSKVIECSKEEVKLNDDREKQTRNFKNIDQG